MRLRWLRFSNFDSGTHPSSKSQPERFYHGFVLGLLVELRDRYQVKSNRESGYGRYDVMLIPRNVAENAMILEFKVFDVEEEYSLQDTVKSALRQIEEKQYDTELLEAGISKKSDSSLWICKSSDRWTIIKIDR